MRNPHIDRDHLIVFRQTVSIRDIRVGPFSLLPLILRLLVMRLLVFRCSAMSAEHFGEVHSEPMTVVVKGGFGHDQETGDQGNEHDDLEDDRGPLGSTIISSDNRSDAHSRIGIDYDDVHQR